MFERYKEKARRVIVFARYEAGLFEAMEITAEHILLAIFREAPDFMQQLVPAATEETVRNLVGKEAFSKQGDPMWGDLPLNPSAKLVLAFAAEEAERLGHPHIGHEHLLLALVREEGCLAATILREHGFDIVKAREEIARIAPPRSARTTKREGLA